MMSAASRTATAQVRRRLGVHERRERRLQGVGEFVDVGDAAVEAQLLDILRRPSPAPHGRLCAPRARRRENVAGRAAGAVTANMRAASLMSRHSR